MDVEDVIDVGLVLVYIIFLDDGEVGRKLSFGCSDDVGIEFFYGERELIVWWWGSEEDEVGNYIVVF